MFNLHHSFKVAALLWVFLAGTSVIQAQFFTLPGNFSYALNSVNQVFDVTPDGQFGITLRNNPASPHQALLTSFDPLLGTAFDSEAFGFGPLGVAMAQTANGLRVVVLTSEGGPRTIYLFELNAAGSLTQLASTQLTTSGTDFGSNLVLSGASQIGYAIVAVGSGPGTELVAFSLVDGTVLNRFPVSGGSTLAMNESGGRRILAFFRDLQTLRVVDTTTVGQPMLVGDFPVPSNNEFSASSVQGIAFSGDGRFVFAANQFADFAVIDLMSLQRISTIGGNFRFGRVRVFESGLTRLLALQSTTSGTGGGQAAILLVNASDPFNLTVINQLNFPSDAFNFKSDLAFSMNGTRLFVQTNQKLTGYDLPSFTNVWERTVFNPLRENQLMVYGNDEVLGAWDVTGGPGFISQFGAFPGFPPNISISDASVGEGDSGTSAVDFSIALSAATTHRVTINFATADGTAVQGSDFTPTSDSIVFEPGQTAKTVTVQVVGDLLDEFDETFNLNLPSATVGVIIDGQGTCAILDNDPPPSVSINDTSIVEGNTGLRNASFTVNLSMTSGKPITVDFATTDGTATAGSDYASVSGTLSFAAGQTSRTILVPIMGETANEPDETFLVTLSNPQNVTLGRAQATGTIINDDTPIIRFASASLTINEHVGTASIMVARSGDTSGVAAVDYSTSDMSGVNNCNVTSGAASSRCDYLATIGTLGFADGETSKVISVPIVDDSYAEGNEMFTVTLSNVTGASLSTPGTNTVTINDNETTNGTNPIDQALFFVRQHYIDFLNREPDAAGLAFWVNEITSCGMDAQCIEIKRINVSAAFFLSIEFQETGFLVYRMFKTAYGDTTSPNVTVMVPIIRLNEFLPDAQRIGRGVQVGIGDWEAQLEANKNAYAMEFVSRQRFLTDYPLTMTAEEFVDQLNMNAGGVLSQAERDQLVAELNAAGDVTTKRASVVRKVAEDADLKQQENNRAFVLMQYYGYLRRNPDDPQDNDFRGWEFWLTKLNQFNGNFVQAEMVKAFISSIEYRQRFGP